MGDSRPIAVFDSGAGGLTVVAEITRRLPGEAVVYLGDTARVPYGSRSPATIVRYARECAAFLLAADPKALVVACNTVSAVALEALAEDVSIPLFDVVGPGATAACEFSQSGRIGVIATEATIRSGAYGWSIRSRRADAEVHERPAPLLVPLVEEGWRLDSPVVRGALDHYLKPLLEKDIDVVVLGCTHYPILKPAVRIAVGEEICIVDSAEETASRLALRLRAQASLRPVTGPPDHRFLVTDDPDRFQRLAARFLMDRHLHVERVDLADGPGFFRGAGPSQDV